MGGRANVEVFELLLTIGLPHMSVDEQLT